MLLTGKQTILFPEGIKKYFFSYSPYSHFIASLVLLPPTYILSPKKQLLCTMTTATSGDVTTRLLFSRRTTQLSIYKFLFILSFYYSRTNAFIFSSIFCLQFPSITIVLLLCPTLLGLNSTEIES